MKKCQNMQSDIFGLFPMKKEKELNTLISTKTFHFYILIDSHLVLFFYEAPALLEILTPVACNNCSDDDNSNDYDDCDNYNVKKSK